MFRFAKEVVWKLKNIVVLMDVVFNNLNAIFTRGSKFSFSHSIIHAQSLY